MSFTFFQEPRVSNLTLIVTISFALWAFGNPDSIFAQAGVRLTGQVTDQSGAAIPGVAVKIDETNTGVQRASVSNELGYYTLDGLSRGSYRLTASATGFADTVILPIVLQVGQVASVNVMMKPGDVMQEVTVSATEVALETQTSSLGGVVSEQVTRQLPLLLRDPTQLVNLVPGVTSDHRREKGTFAGPLGGLSFQTRLDFTVNGGFRGRRQLWSTGSISR